MSSLKICRICLRTEAKMYHFNLYQLKLYYEEVMALKVQISEEEGLPHHFCYECATLLHKFHKFKEKCYTGQKILKELLWRGPITYESIYKVDRKEIMLTSPLSIMTVTNRIKTYTTKDSKELERYNRYNHQINQTNVTKIENIELDYFSEASLSDREDNIIELTDDGKLIHDEKIKLNDAKITCDDDKLKLYEENLATCDDNVNFDKEKVNSDDDNLNFDKEKESNEEENLKIHEVKKGVANSPLIVYVEAENGVVKPKCVEMKEKRKTKGKRVPAWKCKVLEDKNNWKTSVLSEEEALEEFRARAEDKKYLAAAFKCKDCLKGFSKKDMLDRHVQLRHIEQLGSFECRFCHYRFRLECHMKKHMRQHYTRFECLRCHLLCPLENTALLHEEYHSGVTRKCNYCDEEFRHSSTYYTHLRTHRSEHVCTLCGASFVSAIGLRIHKKIKHIIIEIESPDDDEEVNTYCQRCDIRFETRKAYEEHLFHSALHSEDEGRKLNESEDKNDSDSTEKVSASKKVLGKREQAKITKELRKRGNDEDPFNSKSVGDRKRLRKKDRRQRTKPTTCHQCGKHFATQAACMKHHMEAHPRTSFHPPNERYICEICGASLAPGSIATHQNMHTREKLHTCDTCGRQFHAVIGLKRHLVTHTGEKPYACPLCDKRFTQSNSMKLHYRTFHLKQPYPKRNRRKKTDEPKETAGAGETNSEESSDDSLPDMEPRDPEIEPVTDIATERADDSMHYLTLT